MSLLFFCRSTAILSATNRQLSTVAIRPWRPCHRHILQPHFRRTEPKYTICTSIALHGKKEGTHEINAKKYAEKNRIKAAGQVTVLGTVEVWNGITVGELCTRLDRSLDDMRFVLSSVANMKNARESDKLLDTPQLHAAMKMCGYKMKLVSNPHIKYAKKTVDGNVYPRPDAPSENLEARPPVITVMGHVDHGKTTLLDTLRGESVAAGEAGGITQHIGAFSVTLDGGGLVTFLDTPGHAAFSAMRARGAHCTDIIVLVVAAEDGVMPQTVEVLELARNGNIPLVIAINKIDAPNANVEAAKQGLLKMGLNLEGHGGDVQWVPISALLGKNLDKLVDAITTEAVMMNLQSEYSGLVEGVVVESRTDPSRGKLSTMIVTRGTLRKGSVLVAGTAHAKVRAIFDHSGQPIERVTPGLPAEILGWRELPSAGEIILEVDTEKKAHSVVKFRERNLLDQKATDELGTVEKKRKEHNKKHYQRKLLTIAERRTKDFEDMRRVAEDDSPTLNIVVKGDVHGSVEAILDVLATYNSNDICRMNVVHHGVGPVSDGDIEMATAFDAIIYSFSVALPKDRASIPVDMREFNVIYRLIENIQAEISRRLPEVDVDDVVGEAVVQQVFMINERSKKVPVLGCRCTMGELKKSLLCRVIRSGETVYDGKISSMRNHKTEVTTIKKNTECGIQLADKQFLAESDDKVICYTIKQEKVKVKWSPVGFSSMF